MIRRSCGARARPSRRDSRSQWPGRSEVRRDEEPVNPLSPIGEKTLPQFRAIIESESPVRLAARLEEAGCTLLGPWAAETAKAGQKLGLVEELDVSVLLEARDSSAATERLRELVDSDACFRILQVVSADAEPDDRPSKPDENPEE
jgi:hypothetical protein